jgi:hypothetical protein
MVKRFQYKINTRKAAKVTRKYQVGSTGVANEKQINEWCNNLMNFIIEFDQNAPGEESIHKAVEAYNNACEAAVQVLVTAGWAGGVAPGPNPGPPGMPIGFPVISAELRREIWAPYSTQIDTAIIAGAAALAYVPVGDFRDLQISEDEFEDHLWFVLSSMASSGFTGVGDYDQDIEYQIEHQPEDMILTFKLKTCLGRCLPEGVTPMNLGRAYAEFITSTAKEQDFVFDWGERHGVPRSMNHLGHPAWNFIKDKTLMSDEQKRVMQEVTAIALRDKDSFSVNDPSLPIADVDETKKMMANLTIANRTAREKHGYKPSRHFDPNFQFGGSSKDA